MEVVVRRWGIGSPILKTKGLRLSGIGWNGVVVAVGEIWMVSPIEVVSV